MQPLSLAGCELHLHFLEFTHFSSAFTPLSFKRKMPQERVHEEQPLRCMASYYDYGPSPPALHAPTALFQPPVRRSIPGRMANYMEDRSYQAQHGYRKIEGPVHRSDDLPQAREDPSQNSAIVRQELTASLVSSEEDNLTNR